MHFKPKLIEALVGYNRERLFKGNWGQNPIN